MYQFEVKTKVSVLYEIFYEELATERIRGELCSLKTINSERFTDYSELVKFAKTLVANGTKVLQVIQVHDLTHVPI